MFRLSGFSVNKPFIQWWTSNSMESERRSGLSVAQRRKTFTFFTHIKSLVSRDEPCVEDLENVETSPNRKRQATANINPLQRLANTAYPPPPGPSSVGLIWPLINTASCAKVQKRHLTNDGEPSIDWKHLYRERLRLEKNWDDGIASTKIMQGHGGWVYTVAFDEAKIISGSRDQTIKIWDNKVGLCHRTLTGHTSSVLCLQYDDEKIVSGSSDARMIVWDLANGSIKQVLSGHQDSVLGLQFNPTHLLSCSVDQTLCLWKWDTIESTWNPSPVLSLTGHRSAVNAVQLKGGEAASASGDRTIRLWSLVRGQSTRTINAHSRGIACLHYSSENHRLVSGSSDRLLKIWDTRQPSDSEAAMTLEGHAGLIRSLCHDDEYKVVTGSYDGTIKVWDIRSGRAICNIGHLHQENVFKVAFNGSKIVSSGRGTKVYVSDFGINVDTTFLV